MTYTLPAPVRPVAAAPKTAYLVASGDLRESANTAGWPTQQAMEHALARRFRQVAAERRHRVPCVIAASDETSPGWYGHVAEIDSITGPGPKLVSPPRSVNSCDCGRYRAASLR